MDHRLTFWVALVLVVGIAGWLDPSLSNIALLAAVVPEGV